MVCSHDPIFRTDKESQFGTKTITGTYAKFVGAFHLSKLRIGVSEGHFQCVHTIRFSELTKIESSKTDRVNRPLRCFEMAKYSCRLWHGSRGVILKIEKSH